MSHISIRFFAVFSLAILATTLFFTLETADAARFNRGQSYRPHHGQSQAAYLRQTARDRQNGFRNHNRMRQHHYPSQYNRNPYSYPRRQPGHYRNQYQFQRPTTVHPGARLQGPRPSYGIQVRY